MHKADLINDIPKAWAYIHGEDTLSKVNSLPPSFSIESKLLSSLTDVLLTCDCLLRSKLGNGDSGVDRVEHEESTPDILDIFRSPKEDEVSSSSTNAVTAGNIRFDIHDKRILASELN